MDPYVDLLRPLLFRLPADRAHDLAHAALGWPAPWQLLGRQVPAPTRAWRRVLRAATAGSPMASPLASIRTATASQPQHPRVRLLNPRLDHERGPGRATPGRAWGGSSASKASLTPSACPAGPRLQRDPTAAIAPGAVPLIANVCGFSRRS